MKNPFSALFERRSIGSPADLMAMLESRIRSVSGQVITESTSLNVAAVWTGVAIRSRLLSTLPIDVIERISDREVRRRPDHPVARLLNKPNGWQTRSEFLGMVEAHRVLRGNAYAWKNYITVPDGQGVDRRMVAELIPLHPDRIEVETPDDEFAGSTAYRYTTRRGQQVVFRQDEILHLRNLSTDGRMGRPFLEDLRETIGGALATQEHANSLWSRDATPSVVLRHPKTLSDQARRGLERSWESTYGRGADKRRVAVIEESMEIEQLSLSPNDGQFLETKQDLRAEIAAALMVPPHLMGLADKATSWGSGIEQQQIGLLTLTLRPDLTAYEQRLGLDLFTRPDKFSLRFNVNAMLRGDMANQSVAFQRYIAMGVYSPNDVRALLDENPIDQGDVYLQPTNMAPLGWDPSAKPAGA